MNERLVPLIFRFEAQGDADGVAGVYVPESFLLTKISVFGTVAGSPSDAGIDVQDDTVDIVTDNDIEADAITALATPVLIAKDSLVEIDMNFTAGSTPTFTGDIILWGFISE